jgi:hypothetical protein
VGYSGSAFSRWIWTVRLCFAAYRCTSARLGSGISSWAATAAARRSKSPRPLAAHVRGEESISLADDAEVA